MSFSAPEIATMLNEYEADYHTGMDIKALSEKLRAWTGGYPFLVSRLCQIIDKNLDKDWTLEGLEKAVKIILQEQNTLFESMIYNLETYHDLYVYIYELLIVGIEKRESIDNPVAGRGLMFSFLKSVNGYIVVANRIFENRLINYYRTKEDTYTNQSKQVTGVLKYDVVENGTFNMELALRKFAKHYGQIFTESDKEFLERNGRMVFLMYILPLINGEGFYHLESQFTDSRRMDIVVDYGKDEFIIELKLWHGEVYEEKAYQQLTDYLHSRTGGKSTAPTGYLVCFDLRKEKKPQAEWIEKNGCRIFEVVL
jgi:hypothetical protein